MNYLQLINEVLVRCDQQQIANVSDTNSPRSKQVKSFLNQVYKDIFNQSLDWNFREKEGTINIISGTTEYALPDDCDVSSLKKIRYADTNQEINQMSYNDFDSLIFPTYDRLYLNVVTLTEPRPVVAYIFNNKLVFFPSPSSNSAIKFRYQVIPTDLTDGDDEPIIPAQFHNLLVYGASAMLRTYLKDNNGALADQALFNDGVQKMLSHNRKFFGHQPSAKLYTYRRKR